MSPRTDAPPSHEPSITWAYEGFLDRFPYHHFVTLTFRNEASRYRADAELAGFVRRLERMAAGPVWWAMVFETVWDGRHLHLHGLLGGTAGLSNAQIGDAWKAGDQIRVEAYDPSQGAAAYLTKRIPYGSGEIEISHNLERDSADWIRRQPVSFRDRSGVRGYVGTSRETEELLLAYDQLFAAPYRLSARLRHHLKGYQLRDAIDDLVVQLSGASKNRPLYAWGPINPVGSTELLVGGCESLTVEQVERFWLHGRVTARAYNPGIGPTRNFSDPIAVIELDHFKSAAFHEAVRRARHRLGRQSETQG